MRTRLPLMEGIGTNNYRAHNPNQYAEKPKVKTELNDKAEKWVIKPETQGTQISKCQISK